MHANIGFDATAEPERYFHWRPDSGESLADVCARVQSFLDDLSGTAVIVAHGGTFRALSPPAVRRSGGASGAPEGAAGRHLPSARRQGALAVPG